MPESDPLKITCFLDDLEVRPSPMARSADDQAHDEAIGSLVRRLSDLRDPHTGESIRITLVPRDGGLDVKLHGTEAVVRMARARLGENPVS